VVDSTNQILLLGISSFEEYNRYCVDVEDLCCCFHS